MSILDGIVYTFTSPQEIVVPIPGRVVLRFMHVVGGGYPQVPGRENWTGPTPGDVTPVVTWNHITPAGLTISQPERPNTISWIRNTAGSGLLSVAYRVCDIKEETVCQVWIEDPNTPFLETRPNINH